MIRARIRTKTKAHSKRIIRSIRKASSQAMSDVMVVAKQIVPLDEGDLRKSGKKKVTSSKHKYKVVVSFGNGNVDYARDQHETNYFHHNGRERHYLIKPFRQMKSGIKNRIKQMIKGTK